MKKALLLSACATFVLALPMSADALRLNEIRIDNTGTDSDEYIELQGTPGQSLSGYFVVGIGDASGSGLGGGIDMVLDLSPYSIQADGYLAIHDSDDAALPNGTCGGYDIVNLTMNIENSDNMTFLLVNGWTFGGTDVDTDDNGVIDGPYYSQLIDSVGLVLDLAAGDLLYSPNLVGPDGAFVPGHVFFCAGIGWQIGSFTLCAQDSPGAANPNCPISVEQNSWGRIKAGYDN
jgi:hypothetical protein